MNIQTHTESVAIQFAYSLMHVQVTDAVVAYKLGKGPLPGQDVPAQLGDKLALSVQEGLTSPRQIREFLKGKQTCLKPIEGLSLVHSEYRKAVQSQGFMGAADLLDKKGQTSISQAPFTDFTENRFTADDLVRIDYSSHMLFDPEGNSLPVAIYCDYIQARFRNGCYNLEKAAEILMKDPRVRFVDASARPLADPTKPIVLVPYYNCSAGCTSFLSFWFMPTEEDAIRLWKQQLSYKSKYPSTLEHQAMFDLDILGLRAGGAAKYEDFYAEDEKVDENDSDF